MSLTGLTFWTEGSYRRGTEVSRRDNVLYPARKTPSHKRAVSQRTNRRLTHKANRLASKRDTARVLASLDPVDLATPDTTPSSVVRVQPMTGARYFHTPEAWARSARFLAYAS